ncbi:UDP-N-acetylmuramate--L-alanine ligase [Bacteroidia bacterium]|nr:UDP-N-acetylmuramate--L-alanine ligase [Bacteroidia bacterium]
MNNIYFIGIGGIGMSALARYFLHYGNKVAGYDRTRSPLTCELAAEGISIHYDDGVSLIPTEFKSNNTLVIYTPAVGDDNAELQYFQQNGNKIIKRSAALGVIANHHNLLAVAGTHGKTTTSTLLAHLLTVAGDACTAFLGGISKNYGTNLLLAPNEHAVMVAEADEYDRSFLQLHPTVAIVTSMDADHLDIYGNTNELEKSFRAFALQIKQGGTLIVKKQFASKLEGVASSIFTYSYNEVADFYAAHIVAQDSGLFSFDMVTPFGTIENCTVGIGGWVNVENAVAATAAALCYHLQIAKDISFDVLARFCRDALKSFVGVQRRLDVHIQNERIVYIDDYAHHPAEIAAAISSVRTMFPRKKITGIFQPHLYTRTRDFAQEFGKSLSALDQLILLDIYPAREKPIEGVSSQIIFDNLAMTNKQQCSKDNLLNIIRQNHYEVVMTMGAGDIDTLINPLKNYLQNE